MKNLNKLLVALLCAVAVLAGGCVAYVGSEALATVYGGGSYGPNFRIAQASRPAGKSGLALKSDLWVGSCQENGSGTGCPHDGETLGPYVCTAKNSSGTTIAGWNYITAWQYPQTLPGGAVRNDYILRFAVGTGTEWPSTWPHRITCTVAGDNPPGSDNWTGDSYTKTVLIKPGSW